jgi:hypothetical protein
MEKRKTGFWRGFTWRRYLKNICWVMLFYIVCILFDAIVDGSTEQSKKFSFIGILVKLGASAFIAFFLTLWHEPGIDDGALNKKKISD